MQYHLVVIQRYRLYQMGNDPAHPTNIVKIKSIAAGEAVTNLSSHWRHLLLDVIQPLLPKPGRPEPKKAINHTKCDISYLMFSWPFGPQYEIREPVSEKRGLVHIFHISLMQRETASLKMCYT